MTPPLSPEGYAATGGTACPACGGRDLAHGRFDWTHADTVTRRWACEHCAARWTAVYELTGYEGLETLPAGPMPEP
jgi:DNA-directed RNA polymerase subunit RPC12/RpoP